MLTLTGMAGLGAQLGPVGLAVGPVSWLAVAIALIVGKSTRPWGLGILIGGFGMLIILGGACVALLASLDAANG